MKKILLVVALLFTAFSGQNIFAQRVHYQGPTGFKNFDAVDPAVSKVTNVNCDTVSFQFPITGPEVLYNSNGWGFSSGHNDYGDLAFAERFENVNQFVQLFGVRFHFGWASSSGPLAKVSVKVWQEASGQPGTAIYTQDLLIDDIINANGNNEVTFPFALTLSGPFYVGYEVTYAPGDTVAVFTTRDSTAYPSTSWSKFSNGNWFRFDDGNNSWGLAVASAIYPIVLMGNFPVNVLPNNPTIPSGSQVNLTGNGAATYLWTPATNLTCTNCPSTVASPAVTTTYILVGWDSTHTCTVTAPVTVHVTIVNVEDGLFAGNVKTYPNPSNGNFSVAFHQDAIANLSISVLNALGQAIYQRELESFVGDFQGTIPLHGASPGIYTLVVSDGTKRFIEKLSME